MAGILALLTGLVGFLESPDDILSQTSKKVALRSRTVGPVIGIASVLLYRSHSALTSDAQQTYAYTGSAIDSPLRFWAFVAGLFDRVPAPLTESSG